MKWRCDECSENLWKRERVERALQVYAALISDVTFEYTLKDDANIIFKFDKFNNSIIMENGVLGFTRIQCTQDGSDHSGLPIMQLKRATITVNTDINFAEDRTVNGSSSTLLDYILKREIGHTDRTL